METNDYSKLEKAIVKEWTGPVYAALKKKSVPTSHKIAKAIEAIQETATEYIASFKEIQTSWQEKRSGITKQRTESDQKKAETVAYQFKQSIKPKLKELIENFYQKIFNLYAVIAMHAPAVTEGKSKGFLPKRSSFVIPIVKNVETTLKNDPSFSPFQFNFGSSNDEYQIITPASPHSMRPLFSSLVKGIEPLFITRNDLINKTFLIDKITGYNDLAIITELQQILYKQKTGSLGLDQQLNQSISLESVSLTVQEKYTDTYHLSITISGIIAGNGIYMTLKKAEKDMLWEIKEVSADQVRNDFKNAYNQIDQPTIKQKSLPEILRERTEKITA